MADMNFGVNILPNEDNSYNLGGSNKEWQNIYTKTVTIKGNTMASQEYVTNLLANINLSNSEFIISTNNASSAALTGALADSTPIADGKIINYMLKYDTPNNTNLTLTLDYPGGGQINNVPIYMGSNPYQISLPGYTVITIVYYNNIFYIMSLPYAVAR